MMADTPEFPVRTFTVEPGTIIVVNAPPPPQEDHEAIRLLIEEIAGHDSFGLWFMNGGDVTTLDRDEILDRLEDWLRERDDTGTDPA